MFNEKSGKWIRIFKIYTKVMFWLCISVAVVCCLSRWADGIWNITARWYPGFWYTGESVIDGLICLVGGGILAFAQLVVNMLILQYLNNIQIIREKVESM